MGEGAAFHSGVPARMGAILAIPARAVLAERERWVLWLPVLLGLGAGIYFALPLEPSFTATCAVLALAALGAGLAALRSGPRWRVALPLLITLATVALGAAVAQWRSHDVGAPVLERSIRAAEVTGVVIAVEPGPRGPRVVLDSASVVGLLPVDTPARLRLRLRADAAAIRPGDRLVVRARLTPPPSASWPGGYDFARAAWFERFGAVGFALGRSRFEQAAPPGGLVGRFGRAVEMARIDIARRIKAGIDGPAGTVAAALATGLRGDIPERIEAEMRDSGLAHLLAISGLHVGLVAGFVFAVVRGGLALAPAVALRRPIKKWAALAAILAAAGYLLLAGATVPTQRAFIMTGLVLLAVMLDRRGISLRLIAWAAAAILLIRPEALLGVSFQMSFAAVIALVAAYEATAGRFRGAALRRSVAGRLGLYVGAVALTTLVAGLATAPFAMYHFNRIALFSLVANLIAVPLAALWVMPLVVVTVALVPLGLEGLVLPLLGAGVAAILAVAETVASWPGAAGGVPEMPLWGLLAMVGGGLWLCLWRERWRFAGLAAIAVGLTTIGSVTPPDLLISESAKLVALRVNRDGEGQTLYLSSTRAEPFVRDLWTRRIAPDEVRPFPRPGTQDGPLRCDTLGCVAELRDRLVALPRDPRALAEDCAVADAVIATVPLRGGCRGPTLTIDRFDVWRHGAHAVWLDGPALWRSRGTVRTRPWTRAFSWDGAGGGH